MDNKANITVDYNTERMFYGYIKRDGTITVNVCNMIIEWFLLLSNIFQRGRCVFNNNDVKTIDRYVRKGSRSWCEIGLLGCEVWKLWGAFVCCSPTIFASKAGKGFPAKQRSPWSVDYLFSLYCRGDNSESCVSHVPRWRKINCQFPPYYWERYYFFLATSSKRGIAFLIIMI